MNNGKTAISGKEIAICFLMLCLTFRPGISAWGEDVYEGKVFVDTQQPHSVNPFLFGHNILAFDRCWDKRDRKCKNRGDQSSLGGGCWDATAQSFNPVVAQLARHIRIRSLRYPGGDGAAQYPWEETIGSIKTRPMFQFGLDEFLKVVEAWDAVPVITLSYFRGPNHDIDMVEYLNYPISAENRNGGIDWAAQRAMNGHPEPYRVKIYEFGNEVYHGDRLNSGGENPVDYGQNYLRFKTKMREICPECLLGVVLQGWAPGMTDWDSVVTEIVGKEMDFAVVHVYAPGYRPGKGPNLDKYALFETALAAPPQIRVWVETLSRELREKTGRDIPLGVTEYNGSFHQEEPVPYRHCLGNALFNADLLIQFLKTNAVLTFANYWHFLNGYWGAVYTKKCCGEEGEKYYKRPNYFVFEMFARHFGTMWFETKVECPIYVTKEYGRIGDTGSNANAERKDRTKRTGNTLYLGPEKWHIRKCKGVHVSRGGEGDLIFLFNTNDDLNYYHTMSSADIRHGKRYRVSAKLKAIELETLQGVCLEVQDARGFNKVKWAKRTHEVVGKTEWIPVHVDFNPPDGCERVRVIVRRFGKRGGVQGIVKVKDVVLEEIGDVMTYRPTQLVSAIGGADESRDSLLLFCINKDLKRRARVEISFDGKINDRTGHCWVLNGPDVDSTNEKREIHIAITNGAFSVEKGHNKFSYDLEPHSVTAISVGAEWTDGHIRDHEELH